MKKLFLSFAFVAMMSLISFAQLIDEQNVTVTMDLQPVLQLQMETPSEVNFLFDDIQSYIGGKTQFGATVLRVSSTVSWDLYAVGTSTSADAGLYWDQQVVYGTGGTGATSQIPLTALELRQYAENMASDPGPDYSDAFINVTGGAVTVNPNSIWASSTPYVAPEDGKYIQGASGTGAGQSIAGGSYLTALPQGSAVFTPYYITIDYRLVPGLPAQFPMAEETGLTQDGAGTFSLITGDSYAQPGVYSMNVKYVLLEDQ